VIAVHEGVVELVALIGELDGGLVKYDALLHAVAGGKAACGDVADDDLQRDDLDLLDHGIGVGELLHKVGGNALFLQKLHEVVGEPVVDGALSENGALLLAVEGGGVVLIGDDAVIGVFRGKYLLGLAFVKLLYLFHNFATSSCKFSSFLRTDAAISAL